MDIRQCKECGKLFQYVTKPICPECLDEFDNMFLKVRDYIYKNPDADIAEIAEKTEVKEKRILEFLKEERLSLSDANGVLSCESCGRSIPAGRFCKGCKESLSKALQPPAPVQTKPEPMLTSRPSARMHITQTHTKK